MLVSCRHSSRRRRLCARCERRASPLPRALGPGAMQRAASRGGGRFVANALPFLAFMVGGSYGVSVLLQVGPRATRTIRPRHTPPPPPLLPSRTGARLASSVSSAHPDARASLAAPHAHPPRLFSGTERRARRQGGRGRHARAVADADRATAQSRLRPRGGEGEDRGRARRGGGGGDEDGPRASALGGAEGEARARVGGDQAVVRGRGGRVGSPERTRTPCPLLISAALAGVARHAPLQLISSSPAPPRSSR